MATSGGAYTSGPHPAADSPAKNRAAGSSLPLAVIVTFRGLAGSPAS